MIHSLCPLFFVEAGLEPIAVELSGGQFLPPVQKLVATLIYARLTQGQKCKSSPVTGTISSVHNGFDRCGHSIFSVHAFYSEETVGLGAFLLICCIYQIYLL